MATLRYLKRVNRFPAPHQQHFDSFSYGALLSVSGPRKRHLIEEIKHSWHRPPGDNAVLETNLMEFGVPLPHRCMDGDYMSILKKTMDELRPSERIIPLTLGASMKHPNMPKSTSPGFPWVHQGYHTKGDVFADKMARDHIHRTWDSIGRGVPWQLPDSLAFHRVIASEKTKSKIRPVWGYPTEVIVEESRFFFPLFSELKALSNERDTCYGIGMETALSGHAHLARNFIDTQASYLLLSDISNFDSHVTAWIIRDVFSHMSDWFDFSKVQDSEGKIWNVNPTQTARRWKSMISYFINTKIRTPSGLRFQKAQGVPSGSMFTNLMDTIVNAVQMRTALYRMDSYPVKDYYYGDDSGVFIRDNIDIERLAEILLDVFGAVLSVDKSFVTDNIENIHWLGYYYRKTGPSRDMKFIIASTLFPDRPVETPLDAASRLIGQLYSTMDPVDSVCFHDAALYLSREHNFSLRELQESVQSQHPKAVKFLVNLGYDLQDITLPSVSQDPFGDRYILSVLPKPSSRNFFRRRDTNFPSHAFIAEAYQNRVLRNRGFKDFQLYINTHNFYTDLEEDSGYFTA